jgi:hypothetical protein
MDTREPEMIVKEMADDYLRRWFDHPKPRTYMECYLVTADDTNGIAVTPVDLFARD